MTTRRKFLSFMAAAAGMAAFPLMRPRKPQVCVCTIPALFVVVSHDQMVNKVMDDIKRRFNEALQRDPWHVPIIQHDAVEYWSVADAPLICPLHPAQPVKMITVKGKEIVIA